jgi:hypothetical protein
MGINPFDNSNSDDQFLNVPGQMIPDGFYGGGGGGTPDTWVPPPDQNELKDAQDKENAEKERNKEYAKENKKDGGKLKIGKIFKINMNIRPKDAGSGSTEISNPAPDTPAPWTDPSPVPYMPFEAPELRPEDPDPKPNPNPSPPDVIKSPEPAPDSKPPRRSRD